MQICYPSQTSWGVAQYWLPSLLDLRGLWMYDISARIKDGFHSKRRNSRYCPYCIHAQTPAHIENADFLLTKRRYTDSEPIILNWSWRLLCNCLSFRPICRDYYSSTPVQIWSQLGHALLGKTVYHVRNRLRGRIFRRYFIDLLRFF